MPKVDVSADELELLIATVLDARVCGEYTQSESLILAELHQKLEDNLLAWRAGGEVDVPVPKWMRALGVASITRVYDPHEVDDGRKTDNIG